MKNNYSISKQMYEDLIKAYIQVAPHSWTQKDAFEKTVKQPAPRFYVSPKQAAQIISPMLRGDFSKVDSMLPNRRRMYYCLYNRVVEMSEGWQFVNKSLSYIMQYAVVTPAPEFFISCTHMTKIRTFLKLGHIDEEGRVRPTPVSKMAYQRMVEKRKKMKELKKTLQMEGLVPAL